MPIPICCPRCGVTREVKDKYAGLKVQCKNCGEFICVTQFEVIEEVEVVEEPVVEAPPVREIHQRRGRVSKSREGMHLGVVVSLFAVGIIIITSLSIGLVSLVNPLALASPRFASSIAPSTMTPPTSPTIPDFPSNRALPHSPSEFVVSAHRTMRKGRERNLEVTYTYLGPAFPNDGYFEIVVNIGNGKEVKTHPVPNGQRHGSITIEGVAPGSPATGDRIEIWIVKKRTPNESGQGECVSNRTTTW